MITYAWSYLSNDIDRQNKVCIKKLMFLLVHTNVHIQSYMFIPVRTCSYPFIQCVHTRSYTSMIFYPYFHSQNQINVLCDISSYKYNYVCYRTCVNLGKWCSRLRRLDLESCEQIRDDGLIAIA